MASKFTWVSLADFRGGRNAADEALALGDTQVVEARNGDWFRSLLFRKVGGSVAPAIGSCFSTVISSLIAHLPGNNPGAAELWGADANTPPIVGRMAAASTFSAVTLKDDLATGAAPKFRGASNNGKLFLAYDSAVDRFHVWDPNLAAPQVRRVGLATPVAPTVANSGSGSYATKRYYRQRYRIKNGTAIVAQSEPSASVAFTPSGSGSGATITKSATISESETHWVLEASADDITFYEVQEVVQITSNSIANPTVVLTAIPHLLTTGDKVRIAGVATSSPTINGDWTVIVTDSTHFTVPVNVTVTGAGGSFTRLTPASTNDYLVATTTYEDRATPASYSAGTISAVLGAYRVPASHKYVIAAFNRVLFMGSHEGGKQSRISYTPAKGTSDRADDERVPDTLNVRNYFDLDEGTGGDGTGFAGPLYGAVFVFKWKQIRKMLPTGSPSPVFDVSALVSDAYGAIEQECICVGKDREGRSAIYFLDSQVGPMMAGSAPPTEIGAGVRDWWDGPSGFVNLAASIKTGQVLYYPKLGQVWFWWATGASDEPNLLAIYTIASGAWSVRDTGGKNRQSRAAVLFAKTPGATMSKDLVPWLASGGANNTLLRADPTPAAIAITSNSVANPTVVQATAHGLVSGETVQIVNNVGSIPTINGARVVTVVDADHVSVPVNASTGGFGGSMFSGASDAGTTYAALLTTKPYAWNNGKPLRASTPYVMAKAAAGVVLTVTAEIDTLVGHEIRTGTIDLTPAGSETRVFKRVEGLELEGAVLVAFSIGDAAAIAQPWTIERIYVPIMPEDTGP